MRTQDHDGHERGHADDLDSGRHHTWYGDRLRPARHYENADRCRDGDQHARAEQCKRLVGVAEHGNVAQGEDDVERGADDQRDAQLTLRLRQMMALKGPLAVGPAKRGGPAIQAEVIRRFPSNFLFVCLPLHTATPRRRKGR